MVHTTPLPLQSIHMEDGLIRRMQQLVRDQVLPYQWRALHDEVEGVAKSHCVENFRIAAGDSTGEYYGMIFQDSDLYKWLEAAAYCLAVSPDPELEAHADEACELIRRAQGSDGYLNTYYTVQEPQGRFTTLQQGHELYCAGHFFEAAAAYYTATGKRSILDTACRFADYLTRVFGDNEGQNHGYPGHQVVEVGLLRLYAVTGNAAYRDLAKHFIDIRGREPSYFAWEREQPGYKDIFHEDVLLEATYAQTHARPVDQQDAVGHSVRALYMYAAMADLAALTEDPALTEACERLYRSLTQRRMYVTGAVGSTAIGESITTDYDLPNDSAYGESCASVALMMFARRMTILTGEGEYYDSVERAFFNQVLGGIALSGKAFYYVGALEIDPERCAANPGLRHVKPDRQKWFDVACCPTNIARTIMSIGGYAFGLSDGTLMVHIPMSCDIDHDSVALSIRTGYPYGEKLAVTARRDGQRIALRWTDFAPILRLTVNGRETPLKREHGYVWLPALMAGDVAEATYDLTPRMVSVHPSVACDVGKATVMRGPVVYCAEQADNGPGVGRLAMDSEARFSEIPAFCGHEVVALRTQGYRAQWPNEAELYAFRPPVWQAAEVGLIPYALRNNRGTGEMRVFLNVLSCTDVHAK